MNKIPVGATIAHAYRFAFRDFFKILGVMWLTMAVMWLPAILMRRQMMAIASDDAGAIGHLLPFLIPFYVMAMVLMVMQLIGIAKLALGTHSGPYWYYFSLGKPVWRLIGSLLLFALIMIVGWIVALIADFILGFLEKLLVSGVRLPVFTGIAGFIVVIAMIATQCGVFYCAIRLCFLLTPVVAAEENGSALRHAWNLGKGNFWRMFAILIVVTMPFLLLEGGFMFYLFHGIGFPAQPATAGQVAAFRAAINAHSAAMMNGIYQYWYLIYPPFVAVMVLFYGSAVGAQAFAYRAVTRLEGPWDSAPIAGD